MRLLSFSHRGKEGWGIAVGAFVADLSTAAGGAYPTLADFIASADFARRDEFVRAVRADIPLAEIRFLPVIPRPEKIVLLVRNYMDHHAEVVAAVREVAAGNRYVHPALGARMVAADAAAQAAVAADPLSDREREVLKLLALGHTNQEIAKQLYISVRTAETHRAHIMRKLQLSTRAELVRYAIEHGQLEPE